MDNVLCDGNREDNEMDAVPNIYFYRAKTVFPGTGTPNKEGTNGGSVL